MPPKFSPPFPPETWDVSVGRIKDRWDKTQIRIEPFSDVEGRFAPNSTLCAQKKGARRLLTIRESHFKAGFWVCDCGFSSPDEAESWRGAELFVHRSMRPALPEGRFYPDELLGFAMEDENGQSWGEIEEVLETPHYEIYATPSAMVPAVPEFIVSIDAQNRKIIVRAENLREES